MNYLTNAILISGALSLSSLNAFADTAKPVPVKIDRTQKVETKNETTIRDIRQSVIPDILRPTKETVEHRVGNGGEELELDLKKRSQQIGYFLNSTMGKNTFPMLNTDHFVSMINSMDIDVTSNEVFDRYDTPRTCINEPARKLITCNASKVEKLLQKQDILTAMLFHEILGLMELELGYQDNVSMYPISSKILPFHKVIASTPISERQIRPEFYGVDNRSYGLTLVNKETKESIRLICLNDNVEVHRCRNYALVRKANKMQAPMIPEFSSVSPSDIKKLVFHDFDVSRTVEKLEALQSRGVKFVSIGWKLKDCGYRFGVGAIQKSSYHDFNTCFNPLSLILSPIDVPVEVLKQTANAAYYPVKAIIYGLRSWKLKRKIKKFNHAVKLAHQVLNSNNDLSMIGKTKSVSEEDYLRIIGLISSNASVNL